MQPPSRRIVVLATLAAMSSMVAFFITTERSSPPTTDHRSSPVVTFPTELSGSRPMTTLLEQGPVHLRCPDFTPRTAPLNGPGWKILNDPSHCITVEYPGGWQAGPSATGVTVVEPTGHEGEYFETAYPGELTAIFSMEIEDASSGWSVTAHDPFPVRGIVRHMEQFTHVAPDLHVRTYRLGNTHGRQYLYFHPDRFVVTMDGVAPEKDTARQERLRLIMRSVQVHGVEHDSLRMNVYVK